MGTVTLWSTGVDDQGLPLKNPTADPHWWIVSGPGITQPQQAVVLGDQRSGTYFMTSTSKWIGVDANGTGDPSDYYVYRMRFALELDFTKVWVRITGQWSVDNYGEIRFDGHPLPAGSATRRGFSCPDDKTRGGQAFSANLSTLLAGASFAAGVFGT